MYQIEVTLIVLYVTSIVQTLQPGVFGK